MNEMNDSKEFYNYFTKDKIEEIARNTNFIARERKFSAFFFR